MKKINLYSFLPPLILLLLVGGVGGFFVNKKIDEKIDNQAIVTYDEEGNEIFGARTTVLTQDKLENTLNNGDLILNSIEANNATFTTTTIIEIVTSTRMFTDLLGVGTEDPIAKAQLVGDGVTATAPTHYSPTDQQKSQTIAVQGDGSAYVYAEDVTNDVETAFGASTDGSGFIGTISSDKFNIRTGNSNKMTIDTNGYVGIGTTAPMAYLNVSKNATSYTDTLTDYYMYYNNTGGSSSSGNKNVLTYNNYTGTTVYGNQYTVNIQGNSTLSNMSVFYVRPYMLSSGNVNSITGFTIDPYTYTANASGSVGSYSGLTLGAGAYGGGATSVYNNFKQLSIQNPVANSTNKYGIFLQNITGGSSSNYSIYSEGGLAHFSGGIEADYLQAIPKSSDTCSATEKGRIYFDSDDNHFYGCNGTSFVQLDN